MSSHHSITRRLAVVALTVLSLAGAAACSSDTTSPSTTTTTTTTTTGTGLVTVFINNGVYSPNPVTVSVGQSVNWKNNDLITHTATSTSGPITFDNNNIAPNSAQGAPVVMTVKGTITYKCTIHGETGSIIVQ